MTSETCSEQNFIAPIPPEDKSIAPEVKAAIINALGIVLAASVSALVAYLIATREGELAGSEAAKTVAADVADAAVEEKIRDIATGTMEIRLPGVRETAKRAGLVVVDLRASGKEGVRKSAAYGYVDGERIASGAAQDSNVLGVPSISDTSFTMPVAQGSEWYVEVTHPSHAEIRWFSPIPLATED